MLCNDLLLMKSIVHLFIWKLFSGTGFHYFYSIWLNYIGAIDLNVCLCWIPFYVSKTTEEGNVLLFPKTQTPTKDFPFSHTSEKWDLDFLF